MLVPNLALISLGLVSFSGVAVCFDLDPETECRHFEKKSSKWSKRSNLCNSVKIYRNFSKVKSNLHAPKYTRVNILRCANFTRGKQMAHGNANTHRSILTFG